ncbi:hypothetical protein Tco_1013631 [Tanacetum coccineum]
MLDEYIASGSSHSPMVKSGWAYIRFGVSGESKAIIHVKNRLIEGFEDDVGLSMLLVDFKNAFNCRSRVYVTRSLTPLSCYLVLGRILVLSSSSVAPYSDDTLEDLKTHPFQPAPSLPQIPLDHHHLIASSTMVLERIKSMPRGTSCGWDGLRDQYIIDCLSGAVV